MSERHELEMKAEEIFNMVFAPLGWDPDDDDEAKDIVDRAVNDGLMEMPDPDDMESALDECAQTAQEKAMAACMSIISAMVEQYEEDKNQTWN